MAQDAEAEVGRTPLMCFAAGGDLEVCQVASGTGVFPRVRGLEV